MLWWRSISTEDQTRVLSLWLANLLRILGYNFNCLFIVTKGFLICIHFTNLFSMDFYTVIAFPAVERSWKNTRMLRSISLSSIHIISSFTIQSTWSNQYLLRSGLVWKFHILYIEKTHYFCIFIFLHSYIFRFFSSFLPHQRFLLANSF